MNYFWPGSVNKNWGPRPVNTNLVPGPVNTNWGPGPGPGAGKYKYPKEFKISKCEFQKQFGLFIANLN